MGSAGEEVERFIVDASVFAPLIMLGGGRLLAGFARSKPAILDLTVYEACNAYWKLCLKLRKISREAALKACLITLGIARMCEVYRFDDLNLEEVQRTALESSLTFYDAAYIVLARRLGVKLASEDRYVVEKAPKYGVKTIGMKELARLLDIELF